MDRFASIRIPGTPSYIAFRGYGHAQDHSERDLALMEDMNLNEEKKTPLREKDLNKKREMVIQYIFTASKTGTLRSSHQVSPQEFLGELKSGVMDERLFGCLDSLRVSLTSNPVRLRMAVVLHHLLVLYFTPDLFCLLFVILSFEPEAVVSDSVAYEGLVLKLNCSPVAGIKNSDHEIHV
ncbi:unnamed protein product [Pleuronectes platessa]|uniref:Formin GTPase-binding domain-containing protein n=1 Tax=Pleuronectes platessa TaxID=8262 RepID=A0A9N7V2Y9_PLEPL|nr:unnamed protein product [Pleuronectes platessa]